MDSNIPQDPFMLMSFVNMKLRDQYSTLKELCDSLNIDQEWLIAKMKEIGMEYSAENNRFW